MGKKRTSKREEKKDKACSSKAIIEKLVLARKKAGSDKEKCVTYINEAIDLIKEL
tara:strand:+ start:1509 stop:1673 length:165 start_codon:yes stop_codon:yes gene_type:complete